MEAQVPTYQYACTACGHQLEAVQSFSDPALSECPVCEGRLRKLFSAVGIVFKGSGFYRTDSRAGSSADGSGAKDSTPKESTTAASSTDGSSSSSTTPSGSGSADSSTASASSSTAPAKAASTA
jgi:putative FmdB family regulatory protein